MVDYNLKLIEATDTREGTVKYNLFYHTTAHSADELPISDDRLVDGDFCIFKDEDGVINFACFDNGSWV